MLFGAAFYPEYLQEDRLDRDIALMQQANFSYVRVGESTWHLWEPHDGDYQFDWIQRVVDRCHEAGIASVIGTPTYAVPTWLARRYPEIMAETAPGVALNYGGRQNVDITHAAYRFHAERVIRKVTERFAGHPGVIGFQVDNETGVHLLHNPGVRQRFADHLRARYGSVEAVNNAWGTNHWSLGLSGWADLWPAAHNSSPGYDLDWRRFQADLVAEFLDWQIRLVRDSVRADQFVTHCCVGGHAAIRPAADSRRTARSVDLPGANIYFSTQRSLTLPQPQPQTAVPEWSAGKGVWALYQQADFARTDERGFLVIESNAGNAGYPHENHPPFPGQLRQAAYAMTARGAKGIGYWHWHSCHTGKEIYWRGILAHDMEPGRVHAEVSRIGDELRRLAPYLGTAVPNADAALWHSKDSDYALDFLSPLADDRGRAASGAYRTVFDTFYRGCFDAGLQVSIVDDDISDDDLDKFPLLVVPACYVMSDATARRLVDYAQRGGHLVLTFRTAYADETGRARSSTAPGPFAEAAGIRYRDYSNLDQPISVLWAETPIDTGNGEATSWADYVETNGARSVLRYAAPELEDYAAVTTAEYGAGRITWIGTLPDAELARDLARWAAHHAGIPQNLPALPPTVRADSATLPDGRRLWTLTNWAAHPVDCALPFPADDPLTGSRYRPGAVVPLHAHDAVALVQPDPQDITR